MRYLFVCSGGKVRSPLAAKILERIAQERSVNLIAHSIGISALSLSQIKESVQGYNRIIVMEKWMRNRIWKATSKRTNPIILNVSDDYTHSDKYLEAVLERRLRKYI